MSEEATASSSALTVFVREVFKTIRTAFRSKLFWGIVILLTVNRVVGGVSFADILAGLAAAGSFAASLVPGL